MTAKQTRSATSPARTRQAAAQPDAMIDELLDLFGKMRVAEMASYGQIAAQRVRLIRELKEVINKPDVEVPATSRFSQRAASRQTRSVLR